MEPVTVITAGIRGSLFLLVFCLGLGATFHERFYMTRHPLQIIRSLFSMNVVMPVVAAALAKGLDLSPIMKVALIAYAVSPVPPILPQKQLKMGGDPNYIFGLLVSAVLFSILWVPFSFGVIADYFGATVTIPGREIAKVVFTTVLIPLATGVFVKSLAPRFAYRYHERLSKIAGVILALFLLPVLVISWPAVVSVVKSGPALAAIVGFCALGFFIGHSVGGPGQQHKTVLALASASRHPGVAIAIGQLGFPEAKAVPAAVLLILIGGLTLSGLYLKTAGIRRALPAVREATKQAA